MNTIAPRMTDAEADKWLADLMEWIKKNHPHLERRWWEPLQTKHSRYLGTPLTK